MKIQTPTCTYIPHAHVFIARSHAVSVSVIACTVVLIVTLNHRPHPRPHLEKHPKYLPSGYVKIAIENGHL